jgi:hypothetical protein
MVRGQQKGGPGQRRTVAKDEKLLALAGCDLAQQRQQVVGDALRVLAHDAAGVGAAGVEVAQESAVPLLVGFAGLFEVAALGLDVVGDDVLDHRLCAAVRAGGILGTPLGDGDHVGEAGGIAVDGGRGGKDNGRDVVAVHGPEEVDGAGDIDVVVVEGLNARLADGLRRACVSWAAARAADTTRGDGTPATTHLERGKVDDAVDLGVLDEDLVDALFVRHVDLVEERPAAADGLDAVERNYRRVVERVDDDDIVAVLEQSQRGEGANVAGSTA